MQELSFPKLAVLITSFNRRDITLSFLASLQRQSVFAALEPHVYLLDDRSTDGTSTAVKASYPFVHIVTGTGNLFWAGGMRTIWAHACSQQQYDLFLLCNDDVLLDENALKTLLAHYGQAGKKGIIAGSTRDPVTGKLTYGGHRLRHPGHHPFYALEPGERQLIPADMANANILLVSASTVKQIGIFSTAYTHYLADYDYTLTANEAGIPVLLAPGYYGTCADDHGKNWLSGNYSLKDRIRYLYDVKGLAYKEYLFYIRKHFPRDYPAAFVKLWLKTFFPVIWDVFKK